LVPYTVGGGLDDELAIVELERSNTPDSLVTILRVEEIVFAETTVVFTWARPWAHVHVAFVVLAVLERWVDISSHVTEEKALASVVDGVEVRDSIEAVSGGVVTKSGKSPDEFSVVLDVVVFWNTTVLLLVSKVEAGWVPVSLLDGEALAVLVGLGLDGESATTVVVIEETTLKDGSWDVTTADSVGGRGAWLNLVETSLALSAGEASWSTTVADDSLSPPFVIERSLVAFAGEGTFGVATGSILVTVVDLEDAFVNIDAVTIVGLADAIGLPAILADSAWGAVDTVTVETWGVLGLVRWVEAFASVGTVSVGARSVTVTSVGSIRALVTLTFAVKGVATEARVADALVFVWSEVFACSVLWGAWIWVTVIDVGALASISIESVEAAAVVGTLGVDALGILVAIVGLQVALIDIVVAVEVSPSLVAFAGVGVGALISAGTLVARLVDTVVNVDALNDWWGTSETRLALASVGSRGVDAVGVVSTVVEEVGALVDVRVAEGIFVALVADALERVHAKVGAETVVTADVVTIGVGAVIDVVTGFTVTFVTGVADALELVDVSVRFLWELINALGVR